MLTGSRLRQKLTRSADKFHGIGNSTRLSIIYTLGREPMEFGRLASRLKVPPSLLSHHLKKLTDTGWVTRIRVGKLVTYYLSEDTLKEMIVQLHKFRSLQPVASPATRR